MHRMQQILLLLGIIISISIGGCTPPEKIAYRTAVASKAFLDSVKKSHMECTQPTFTSKVCTLLVQATSAKDLLIDAGEVYCGGKGFGQPGVPCNPPKKSDPAYQLALDKLNAAVSNYNQTEKDLKGVL